jgi:thiol-disulfide isomerase/thioredoxin
VIFMTDGHWERYRKYTRRFIVFYHALDCKWCNFSKPGFVEASRKFRRSMPFLAIDCKAAGASTCLTEGLTSYPRLKYYNHAQGDNGPEDPEFFERGPKESGDFVTYVEKKIEEEEARELAKTQASESAEAPSEMALRKMRVKQLRKMLKSRGQVCHGCTDKLEFVKLVRATWHLPSSGNDVAAPSAGSTSASSGAHASDSSSSSSNGKTKAKSKKRRRKTLMQEKREKQLMAEAKRGWSDEEYGNGEVVHSYDGHFEDMLLSKQERTNAQGGGIGGGELSRRGAYLVFFYAPWCGHCKEAKPELVDLSNDLKKVNSPHKIVAIQGDTNVELSAKYKLRIFPTFHVFRNGVLDDEAYNAAGRPRGRRKMFNFLMRLDDPAWESAPVEPFVNQRKWGMDGEENEKDLFGEPVKDADVDMDKANGEVIFMDDDHFNEYRKSDAAKDGFLVFFYAPWCSHCKFAKPHYALASTRLRTEGDESNPKVAKAQLLAMDCKDYGMFTCRDRGIHSYPTLHWFFEPGGRANEAGEVVEFEDWDGGREESAIVNQVRLWLSEGYTPPEPVRDGDNHEDQRDKKEESKQGDEPASARATSEAGAEAVVVDVDKKEELAKEEAEAESKRKWESKRNEGRKAQKKRKEEKAKVEERAANDEDSIDDEMSIREMREHLAEAIKRIGNPDSLSLLMDLARKIEDSDYTEDPDDFEYTGHEEL